MPDAFLFFLDIKLNTSKNFFCLVTLNHPVYGVYKIVTLKEGIFKNVIIYS